MLGYFSTTDAVLSDTTVAGIATAPKLNGLNLIGTPRESATFRKLATKTNLTDLHLHGTGVDGTSAASLATLTKLKVLGGTMNFFTGLDLSRVNPSSIIQVVSRNQCCVTSIAYLCPVRLQ